MAKRIATGVIGGGVFLWLTVWGGGAFAGLIAAIGLGMFYEYVRMHGDRPTAPHALLGFALTFVLIFFTLGEIRDRLKLDLLWAVTFLLLFIAVATQNRVSLRRLSYILVGAVYIGLGLHYFHAVRNVERGLPLTLWVLAVVWTTDTAAYFVGRAFGRHLLWPSISPKKTWEGAVGGLVAGMAAALIAAEVLGLPYRALPLFATAALVSIGGQVGDLIESAIKRSLGVKDSGSLLPGHGGLFDRFDSLIVAFPTFVWAARMLAPFLWP
ncbi:phosphatidate cytidylyltransferase [Hydrogenibacillus schlegelii]|uniref:Phosphatidate cytidylyltransferase n=1 Tax=Hydrogenibacillus schlegelii TaxID=1484 RepID=A0A132MG76_HYDSH|nr:phosphatidate cytidylyltransferase [Hydrogenibacillus schlegelii]KWW96840.1 hypothetical protein TR75_12195 [Hydrogenibacillus schlegelii]OAR04726.1 hypothetical protein SA87_09425 [Hydrogenibacillus schlegelii]PTQ54976.1 MAG: Phosphatidate cytidylyltransferase [Hydrogenibacillus schlegelii]